MNFINQIKKEDGKNVLERLENASSLMIPSFVFKDRRLKVLEVLVEYLKEGLDYLNKIKQIREEIKSE